MKKLFSFFLLSAFVLMIATAFKPSPSNDNPSPAMSLYDSIVMMDSIWEDAYNNCRLDVMEEVISEDLEFYHDRGGLLTSKQKLNDALKNNICGKVKRELKKGSIEVYPINGYGAVQMGMHGFYSSQKPDSPDHYAKFVHIWKRENGKFKITRVISLH